MEGITYIILVNWNGWEDTLECLESIFRQQGLHFRVVVCDNGSNDKSLERIHEWAQGERNAISTIPEMATYSTPPCKKPLATQRLTRSEAEQTNIKAEAPLVLIDCGENLGFAGGNNVGLRFALRQPDMDSAWLLNNDTVIDANALQFLRDKAARNPKAGIIGSTVLYYEDPKRVQAFGGARYFPCIGLSMHIGRFRNRLREIDEAKVEAHLGYILGASMFVPRRFLEAIGLMTEDYFLYYEELDWALRGRQQFCLGYAQLSRVYHKAGASIGSSNKSSQRSVLSDSYLMANRLKITRRFFPSCMPFVRSFLIIEWLIRIAHGRKAQAAMIWQLVRSG